MKLAKLLGLAVLGGVALGSLTSCLIEPPDRPEMDAPGCELRVHFDAQTLDAGQLALARINAATGCEVEEDEAGVPVTADVLLFNEDGTEACGQTSIARYSDGVLAYVEKIEIATEVDGCNSMEAIIIHEVFHAMLATEHDHAEGGVFHAVSGNGESINEATLTKVCTHIVCPSFSPESD